MLRENHLRASVTVFPKSAQQDRAFGGGGEKAEERRKKCVTLTTTRGINIRKDFLKNITETKLLKDH